MIRLEGDDAPQAICLVSIDHGDGRVMVVAVRVVVVVVVNIQCHLFRLWF